MHMGMTNRQHFPRFSTPRARQNSHVTLTADADAAAGLTALPAAVNGMHESLASTANVVPNSTANGLAVPRDTHTARLAQSASIASAGLSQQTSPTQLQVSRDASGTEDPFVQNVVESSEERKRRLARERQRRRRKRLKKNNGGTVKGELDAIQRTADEAPRNGAGGTTGVVTSTLDLPLHVRGGDGGIHGHAPGQIGSNLPSQFEGVNLTSGHHVQTSLQPLQVGGAQEELTAAAAASARGSAFNAHTLGVGNVNASPPVSSVGLVGHQNTGELQRMVTNSEEKRGREQYHNEDSGTRKRRLARDRQRRRRDRLRLKKSGGNDRIDKSPSNSQTMKNAVDGSSGRLMDGELGEADRMPLGSGNSGVFGGRGDVAAQTLSFGDQGRGMRGGGPMGDGTVAGMGISFVTNGGLNLPNMHVGAMGGSGPHNVLHWSHAFESESSARFAVDSAVSAFRAQIAGRNINARNYVIQQGILTLSGTEDASRDMMNGQMMNSLRADGVMRI